MTKYRRKTHDLALAAAYSQGHADALLGLPPSLNPYTQRNYHASYASGFTDALIEAHMKKLERHETAPIK